MRQLEVPPSANVITGKLAEGGKWHLAGVTPATMPWSTTTEKVTFRGYEVWILPLMTDRQPCVAINRPRGLGADEAERLICNLVSSLAWAEGGGAIIEGVWNSSRCSPQGGPPPPAVIRTKQFDLSHLPDPVKKKPRLALALMREARGLNQAAYAFLSFYRVVEVAFPKGRKRGAWVEQALANVSDTRAKAALRKLDMTHAEVGTRLYQGWRMALALADDDPIIDPDDPRQLEQLRADLSIMEALAELVIETELGVETKFSYRKRTRPQGKAGRP